MLAGTSVTAVGFMPNGFAQSTAGEYASNVFWIVGIALIASSDGGGDFYPGWGCTCCRTESPRRPAKPRCMTPRAISASVGC